MDSNPRTAQFFIDGKSVNGVLVDLPESVRVGFSAEDPGIQIRFDRITHLNRSTPITDQMNEIEWPNDKPRQATKLKDDSNVKKEERTSKAEEKMERDALNENIDQSSEQMIQIAQDEEDRSVIRKKQKGLPTMKLPELLFTNQSHFVIRNNVLTRTEKGDDGKGKTRPSTVLLSEPITKGVVSVTFVVLTLAESGEQKGFINFGLFKSSVTVPQLGHVLGKDVQHSLSLSTSGTIHVSNRSSSGISGFSGLLKKDRVVMEVNMDSNPRTVQFFVNGKAGDCYVSGIPESVRIGFSVNAMGTSLQIQSIIHSTQPTPLADTMIEIRWTGTEESLKERDERRYQPIRREAEGSMPALLSRFPKHFKIEGNVITRTAFGCNGLDSPFSTVMLDGEVKKAIKSVAITILALPQNECSCGVVMIGVLGADYHIAKIPNRLGVGIIGSIALCSLTGMVYNYSPKNCHSPLRVGDQVVLEVNTRSKPRTARFFVNGKNGQNEISLDDKSQIIGFSLAGPGTSIRIDAVTDLDKPSPYVTDVADVTMTNESQEIDESSKFSEPTSLSEAMKGPNPLPVSVMTSQQLSDDTKQENGQSLTTKPFMPFHHNPSPSELNQPSNLSKPQQSQSTPQPSTQKTDSVQANPKAASSSALKMRQKPQPLAAKVAARDHPAYEPFFAKLRGGKKAVFLAPEMREKGLNPEALSDPDMLV
ncbi:hypothetical protein BLNAU_10540 [Blattamonas nauphoetae]|uniref:Uncharacterized protein n=1 Tax=Blattamonas nauphoetae TaxID=2049346 RepID=A0ABQ9XT35_9EUKA|nr:hypothetical protein BLNAU_10540 [Blattamonas nauphoetae]